MGLHWPINSFVTSLLKNTAIDRVTELASLGIFSSPIRCLGGCVPEPDRCGVSIDNPSDDAVFDGNRKLTHLGSLSLGVPLGDRGRLRPIMK